MHDTAPTSSSGMTDAEVLTLFRTVETEDFAREDPPEPIWTSILVNVRDTQLQEAQASSGSSRSFGGPKMMLIAAALLAVVLGGAFIARTLGSDPATLVASAAMTDDGLPVATEATADARVVCDDDGACSVEIDFTEVPDAGEGALELWVISADVTDMHSLGIVDRSGTYPLPAGVDAAASFPIVDISVEPDDGDPTHSGQSVLRGSLS